MNTTVPLTISVPTTLRLRIQHYLPARQRSKIISEAIDEKIAKIRHGKSQNPWSDFFALAQKLHPRPGAFEEWLKHRHDDLA